MTNDRELFYSEFNKLLADPKVQRLKEFPQHHGSNTLAHCIAVARRSFELAEQFGWDIDEKELARAALLHDYYLYRIKDEGLSAYRHGTSHPAVAIRNAKKDFGLSQKEMNIIRSHMWPLTFIHPPRSKEAALLCLADKDIAIKEFVRPEIKRAGRLASRLGTLRKGRKDKKDVKKPDTAENKTAVNENVENVTAQMETAEIRQERKEG